MCLGSQTPILRPDVFQRLYKCELYNVVISRRLKGIMLNSILNVKLRISSFMWALFCEQQEEYRVRTAEEGSGGLRGTS